MKATKLQAIEDQEREWLEEARDRLRNGLIIHTGCDIWEIADGKLLFYLWSHENHGLERRIFLDDDSQIDDFVLNDMPWSWPPLIVDIKQVKRLLEP